MGYEQAQILLALVGVGGEHLLAEQHDVPEHILLLRVALEAVQGLLSELLVAGLRAD